ncbi:MAG: hypothetical protein JNK27_13040 [Chitinophagaceae bacterium]|nr:hypothetical protein [Chitinophagaceae bacterium]
MISKKTNSYWVLSPVLGMLLFIMLYIAAALLYPGGSDFNRSATEFSWQNNYWCELLATKAQNGQSNIARPVAIFAMAVLAISLIIFWYTIPGLFAGKRTGSRVIRYAGIGSMLVTPLLLTGFHDHVINTAALLGCIAIIVLLINLFRYRMLLLFSTGILCLLLCGVNNYVYYSKDLLHYLPVIQKISFFIFLLWFCLLSLALYRRQPLVSGL